MVEGAVEGDSVGEVVCSNTGCNEGRSLTLGSRVGDGEILG